ncbi:MAG TPA: hypothetical protein VIK53_10550 [Verrucomicrobiae bacterium]
MSEVETNNREPQEISQVVEHLFRHEAGKMVATLTGMFGIEHLTLAEDMVQEALARSARKVKLRKNSPLRNNTSPHAKDAKNAKKKIKTVAAFANFA